MHEITYRPDAGRSSLTGRCITAPALAAGSRLGLFALVGGTFVSLAAFTTGFVGAASLGFASDFSEAAATVDSACG